MPFCTAPTGLAPFPLPYPTLKGGANDRCTSGAMTRRDDNRYHFVQQMSFMRLL
jgi:hypothetical protein